MSSGSDASYTDGLVDTSRRASATDDLGVSDSDDDESHQDQESNDNESPPSLPERWHVLGLGQAMVLFSV